MLYWVSRSNKFLRSLKRVAQYPNFDRDEIEYVVGLLRSGKTLPIHHHDHNLKGEHVGIRECHIKNDLLLLYQKKEDTLILLLVDIGTHASIFGK